MNNKRDGIFTIVIGFLIAIIGLVYYISSGNTIAIAGCLNGITFMLVGINMAFIMPNNRSLGIKFGIATAIYALVILIVMLVMTYDG